jgi:hypothetical protein
LSEILLQKALAKSQVIVLLVILVIGAFGAYYIAEKELPNKTTPVSATAAPTTTPTPTKTTAPTNTPIVTSPPLNESSQLIVPVSILQPYSPGGSINPVGPTVDVTLQNNATDPVVSLQAILTISGNKFTYAFSDVSESNPLLPNQLASQTEILTGGQFETNQTYPMQIIGTLQNGSSFNFITSVTIDSQYTNLQEASGEKGALELTMTLDKTTYSLGEPVNLTLTITNISNQTITYEHTGLDFDFQVSNGTNNLVYRWSNFQAIAQFIALEPLNPGASRSTNFSWTQICNFNSLVNGDPVTPGAYNIIGLTGPAYGIQTTQIQITIVKP